MPFAVSSYPRLHAVAHQGRTGTGWAAGADPGMGNPPSWPSLCCARRARVPYARERPAVGRIVRSRSRTSRNPGRTDCVWCSHPTVIRRLSS